MIQNSPLISQVSAVGLACWHGLDTAQPWPWQRLAHWCGLVIAWSWPWHELADWHWVDIPWSWPCHELTRCYWVDTPWPWLWHGLAHWYSLAMALQSPWHGLAICWDASAMAWHLCGAVSRILVFWVQIFFILCLIFLNVSKFCSKIPVIVNWGHITISFFSQHWVRK